MVDHAGAGSLIDDCCPLICQNMTVFSSTFSDTLFFPRDEGTLPPDIGKLAALKELNFFGVVKLSGESPGQLTLTIYC